MNIFIFIIILIALFFSLTILYFLKICGGNSNNDKIAQELQKIPAINMSYTINVEELKSKDYLILN